MLRFPYLDAGCVPNGPGMGIHSPRIKAARIEAWTARQEEERKKSNEWVRSCPRIDYGRIVDELIRLRRRKRRVAGRRRSANC